MNLNFGINKFTCKDHIFGSTFMNLNFLARLVHKNGSQILIHLQGLDFLVRQVHKYGSDIMIHIHELEFWERQVHKYGSKVMIHTHALEVFGHTSLQEWITNFDPHS